MDRVGPGSRDIGAQPFERSVGIDAMVSCMEKISGRSDMTLLLERFYLLAWYMAARDEKYAAAKQSLSQVHAQHLVSRETELAEWQHETENWAQALRHRHEVSVS